MTSTASYSWSSNTNNTNSVSQLIPYNFKSITRVLCLLYGGLASFTLNFILHSVKMFRDSPPEHYAHLTWTFVGIATGLNQIVIGYMVGNDTAKSWKNRKNYLFGMWVLQVISTLSMYVHFFIYQQEMHCFYHGTYTSIAVFTIFAEYSYFKRRTQSLGKSFGLTYVCCTYHGD